MSEIEFKSICSTESCRKGGRQEDRVVSRENKNVDEKVGGKRDKEGEREGGHTHFRRMNNFLP